MTAGTSARANSRFHARVVRYLAAECGIRQFLDIGTGLPAADSTHEIAQQIDPGCRVACADLRDTGTILSQAAHILDLTRPLAVLLLAVLHFISDADDPAAIVAALADAITPGSFIAISHLTGDFTPEPVTTACNTCAMTPVQPRSHTEVTSMFDGLVLVPPGVVPVTEWRPSVAPLPHRHTADLYAGVARVRRGCR